MVTTEGLDAVTHANLAVEAGYAKATIYKHWPTRAELLRDAFRLLDEIPHSAPTGDLRADLIAEMTCYRDGMRDYGLDRAMAVLAEQAMAYPELAEIRDRLVPGGDRVVRGLLAAELSGAELEAAVHLFSGAGFYSALMYGRVPDDEAIEATVDLLMRAIRPA